MDASTDFNSMIQIQKKNVHDVKNMSIFYEYKD